MKTPVKDAQHDGGVAVYISLHAVCVQAVCTLPRFSRPLDARCCMTNFLRLLLPLLAMLAGHKRCRMALVSAKA